MAPVDAPVVHVELLFSPAPRTVWSRSLVLAAGSTPADALDASGLLQEHPHAAGCSLALWGRACQPDAVLREGDRLEVLRALKADPKESRRLRYRGQPAPRGLSGAASRA